MTFSYSLRSLLDSQYRDAEFSPANEDFCDLARSHGKSVKNVGCALRYLENMGIIVVKRTEERERGGLPHKFYKVVPNAELVKIPRCNPSTNVRRITSEEASFAECANRINQSLNVAWRMTRTA